MSLRICVCWKIQREQKAKRGLQMPKQASGEAPPATTAASCGIDGTNEQGRGAELMSGWDHSARTTSPGALRDLHLTPQTFRLLHRWPWRELAGPRPSPRISSKCWHEEN